MLPVTGQTLTKEDIIRVYSDALTRMIQEDLERPIETDRITQIAKAKRNYKYWQGNQYLVPKLNQTDLTVDYVSVLPEARRRKVRFCSVYNIIYADGIKFISVVSQRPPNQRCVADDPENNDQIQFAADADTALRYLHRSWSLRDRLPDIALHLWVTGPVFGYTHYVADGHRHGWREEPIVGTEEIVDPMGFPMTVPKVEGMEKFPNGNVDLDLLSVFHVTTPFGAKSIKECDWLAYDSMEPKYRLKAMYESLDEEELRDDAENSAQREAAQAIDEIETPSGDQRTDQPKKWHHGHRWLRPSVYHAFGPNLRKALLEQYPDGLRITMVEGKIQDLAAEKLDDYWAVCKTGTGEHITAPPLCEHMIPVQNDTNNFFNMANETILKSIPKSFVDSTLFDPKALQDNEAIIGEIIRVKAGSGDVSKMIGQLPMARFNDQMMPFWDKLREFSRDAGGIQPAMFGGGQAAPTFRQEFQRKNQALMQLQPPVTNIQKFISEVSGNGVKELARFGVGDVSVSPEGSKVGLEATRHLNLAMLQTGGWHVEADEAVPMTMPEKIQQIADVAKENPMLADSLGYLHPMNSHEMQAMFGVPGMYSPGENERKKAMKRIQDLLQQEPVMDFDPFTGQQMERSSIPPDPFTDKNHAFFADVFRAWCNSPAGAAMEAENPAGYANVKLHGMEQDAAAMAAMAPPPMEGGTGEVPDGEQPAPGQMPPSDSSAVEPVGDVAVQPQ